MRRDGKIYILLIECLYSLICLGNKIINKFLPCLKWVFPQWSDLNVVLDHIQATLFGPSQFSWGYL